VRPGAIVRNFIVLGDADARSTNVARGDGLDAWHLHDGLDKSIDQSRGIADLALHLGAIDVRRQGNGCLDNHGALAQVHDDDPGVNGNSSRQFEL
jgi:hypothetical protein